MKKFTLSLVFAVLCTGGLFAQRTVDMSTTLNKPVTNDNIKNNVPFDINFTITNNGPDVIKTTDTLAFFFVVNNNVLGNPSLYFLTKELAVDSSMTFNIQQSLQGGPSGELSVCASNILVNRGGSDTVKDNALGGNNVACATVNYSNTASIGGDISLAKSNLSAYPNPAKNDVTVAFDATNSSAYSINIMDINGKTVQTVNGTSTNGTNNVNINVSELPAGVYMYQLNMDNASSANKLIITK